MSQTPLPKPPPTLYDAFIYRHWVKLVGVLLWALIIGGYLYYIRTTQLTIHQALSQLVQIMDSPWGPVLYILLYVCSPLIFFSAAVLAIMGGAIFGAGSWGDFILAVCYTIIGSLGAAQMAYLLGRVLGADLMPTGDGLVQRYAERMRQNSFTTVLLMHVLYLPYELVNYLAGILRIDWKVFLLATLVGSFPGLLTFVTFGASLDLKKLIIGDMPKFSLGTLILGLVVFVMSLLIARYLRQREIKIG